MAKNRFFIKIINATKNEKTLNLNSIWLNRYFEITPSVDIFFALFLIHDSGSGEKITLSSSHHNNMMMMMTLWGEDGETLTSSCPGVAGARVSVQRALHWL